MDVLLAVLTPIALLNAALRLPSGIAGIVSSLGTRQPILTASAFVAGKFVPHFVFGLLIVLGLDTAIDQINTWKQDMWRDPSALAVALQLVIGAVMIAFGYRLSRGSQKQPNTPSSIPMTPLRAFSVAAGLTIIGLPGALLYFAAIDQILRVDLRLSNIVKALLYYNFIILLPLILIVLTSRLLGKRSDPIFEAVTKFFQRWGKRLIFFGLLGLGVVLVVDAFGWFLGFPLLPTGLRSQA